MMPPRGSMAFALIVVASAVAAYWCAVLLAPKSIMVQVNIALDGAMTAGAGLVAFRYFRNAMLLRMREQSPRNLVRLGIVLAFSAFCLWGLQMLAYEYALLSQVAPNTNLHLRGFDILLVICAERVHLVALDIVENKVSWRNHLVMAAVLTFGALAPFVLLAD